MFNNLIKLSNGRTTTKILATLLVITLTFANFAMLGTFMLESIAIESSMGEQNTATNNENVKFNVYLDSSDTSVREVSKDINSEDLELYVSVSVTGNGRLEKGSIDFSDSNFKSKENDQIFRRDIETISSQNGITIKLPIVSRKDPSFNLSLLNMISKIKLTGEYIDQNGNSTYIDSTKEVKVNWTTEGITEEQVEVSQEIITNKIYKINGANKRVLQLLVKTNVQDNKVPVKSTKIEIGNPIAELVPEEVKVTTYNTKATNGGSSIEFNNNQGSTCNYNADENKTYIELINVANQDGIVSWQKDATDELILTYIYDEQANIDSVSSDVRVSIVVHGNENTTIQQTNNLALETVEEKGNIIDIQNYINKEIYKGNMYLGEDTEYVTRHDIFVSYVAPANKILIKDGENLNSENLSTYYKSTIINKAQAINVLGDNGTIEICKEDGSTISEITLSQENNEEYFTVNYSENVSNIVIETSEPLKEGKIELINIKAIKVEKLENIEEATTVESKVELNVTNSQNEVIENSIKTATANLLEPTTSVDLLLDKTTISNQVENELTLTAILNTNNSSNKLFDNPTINIELPKEITEATLLENASLLYEDELKIKSSEIITNENGNKEIVVTLEGKQTKYDTSANIVMYLKVKSNPFMADKNVEIKTTCINGVENLEQAEKTTNLIITGKKGLITNNYLKVGEEVVEKINNNNIDAIISNNQEIQISSKIINNFGEEINNANIVGKISEYIMLNSEITTNLNNATIYYSEEINAEQNSNTWQTQVEDYSKIKSIKLEIEKLSQGEMVEIGYRAISKEIPTEEENFSTILELNYTTAEQAKKEEIKFNFTAVNYGITTFNQTEDFIMSIKPKTTSNALHQGQIVTYEIEVKNISGENKENLKLEYVIPEGAVYTEPTYVQGMDVEYTNKEEVKVQKWDIGTLEAGQTTKEEVTVKIGNNTNSIKNTVCLKNSEEEILQQVETEMIEVKKAELEVLLSKVYNVEIPVHEGETTRYLAIVKNISGEEMKNITVKCNIPENAVYINDNEDWIYDEEKNSIAFNIVKLEDDQTAVIGFNLRISKFPQNVKNAKIDNTVVVETENLEEYESNLCSSKIELKRFEIKLEAENNKEIKCGEKVKYVITVRNIGEVEAFIKVIDEIPEEIQVRSAKAYVNNELTQEENVFNNNLVSILQTLESGQTLKIEIEGLTYDLDNDQERKEITNIAKIQLEDEEYLESNEVHNVIINERWENPENPEEPEEPEDSEDPEEPEDSEDPEDPEEPEEPEEPEDSEDPENPAKKYSISGLAWLDSNKNGIRDNAEDIARDIDVFLLDKNGEIVKDSNKEFKTKTSILGTYKFNNLEQGEYTVIFVYDTGKYSISKYQVENAEEENNSDAIQKEIVLDNNKILAGATDTIKLKEKDVQNIDIGLIENPKFDLNLEKYITKVTVINDKETTTYNFDEEKLAKIEIAAKQIENSTILVEYEIKISNEGDVNAYITDIIDYMPKELTFNSEMNKEWYIDSNGILHNIPLEPETLEPNKSQKVKLVLTKTLTANSMGTITNIAEIGDGANLENLKDEDSISANKKTGEDDMSEASLIISIKTGSPIMYIGIVLISLAVIGSGIYLIDKKVLKGVI